MRKITKAGFLMGGLAMTAAVVLTAAPSGAQEDDLNCGDPGTSLNMPVPPGDPDGLDGLDADGIGCEDPSAFGNSGGGDTTTTTVTEVTPPPAAPAPAEPVERQPTFTG